MNISNFFLNKTSSLKLLKNGNTVAIWSEFQPYGLKEITYLDDKYVHEPYTFFPEVSF